jgi:hypothetical protein
VQDDLADQGEGGVHPVVFDGPVLGVAHLAVVDAAAGEEVPSEEAVLQLLDSAAVREVVVLVVKGALLADAAGRALAPPDVRPLPTRAASAPPRA